MLLNKKGSTSYGFVALFFGVFLACFIVAEVNYKSIKKARNSIMNFNENNYEELVIENTKKYIDTYYKNFNLSELEITLETLKEKENLNINCAGYVKVKNINNNLKIEPFINCK